VRIVPLPFAADLPEQSYAARIEAQRRLSPWPAQAMLAAIMLPGQQWPQSRNRGFRFPVPIVSAIIERRRGGVPALTCRP
jgi:hypothetical protein